MKRNGIKLALATIVLFLLVPGGSAVASATVRLVIAHVVSNCHIWKTSTKTLGASTKIVVKPGTRVVIRSDCPMDFDFAQTSGPRLALGDPRTYAGSNRVIVFRKAGVYRLTATNVQTPEERGLVTLGETNTLTLTVLVKP
jgi:hypothetical protein